MAKKQYRDPSTKSKNVLTNAPLSREAIIGRLLDAGYTSSTALAQLHNLRHWAGCIVSDAGYLRNGEYQETPRAAKAKREKATRVPRAVPKPGKRKKGVAA